MAIFFSTQWSTVQNQNAFNHPKSWHCTQRICIVYSVRSMHSYLFVDCSGFQMSSEIRYFSQVFNSKIKTMSKKFNCITVNIGKTRHGIYINQNFNKQASYFDTIIATSKLISLRTVTLPLSIYWDNQTTVYKANGTRTVYTCQGFPYESKNRLKRANQYSDLVLNIDFVPPSVERWQLNQDKII